MRNIGGVQVRFLLGPAGSGKTFRCLQEAREAMTAAAEGPALLFLAPKQSTYQVERQLLAGPSLAGYMRLQVLSFERLADWVHQALAVSRADLLDEEGRLMVLRGLLTRHRDQLQLFRASARLTGFAQQLSGVLREFQRHRLGPEDLRGIARQAASSGGLAPKLHDLATLLEHYVGWLETHRLQDADRLLDQALEVLQAAAGKGAAPPGLNLDQVWVDGFAEFSPQELELLAALLPRARRITIALCLERPQAQAASWVSIWSMVGKTYADCRKRLAAVPGAELSAEVLTRDPAQGRFARSPHLAHLEAHWTDLGPFAGGQPLHPDPAAAELGATLRVVRCPDPESEVVLAAREVIRHVRAGGRYRDISVMVRNLEGYHHHFQRVFPRYEIPYFLDQRESVSHHPLAELTRSALRVVAFRWQHEDWFAALKTGLVPARENEVDRLENEALARGWVGVTWQSPIKIPDDAVLTEWVAGLVKRLLPPFQKLDAALGLGQIQPSGAQLAAALAGFWRDLQVEDQLQNWASADPAQDHELFPAAGHTTVWEQLQRWLENLQMGFAVDTLSLREWLPILEAGLASLSIGIIPPALDQVLVGAIDRSRNPDIRLGLVLGLNEGVFPAAITAGTLLTDQDRLELERFQVFLGATARHQLGRERFLAYIACTRARERLVLSCARCDARGAPLNPSPVLSQLQRLFPALRLEPDGEAIGWQKCERLVELAGLWLRHALNQPGQSPPSWLAELPAWAGLTRGLETLHEASATDALSPATAAALFGSVLRTSVSRLEQFAACPFKYYVHSGLRAEERQLFELDVREQGTFQHDVLALFHEELRQRNQLWRDLAPDEARRRIGRIAEGLLAGYRDGLLTANEKTRFMARVMTESLQDFVETLVTWMGQQYGFDPRRVELPFGEEGVPPWCLDLGQGRRVEIYGRIDRVDLLNEPGTDNAACVVVDYKSSQKQLDDLLIANGLQLQLLTYLNVLCQWPNPMETLGAAQLQPAGVFYVNLRGKYAREQNRVEALANAGQARKSAYRHAGRFDVTYLRQLDRRSDAKQGDQFNYRLTKDGQIFKNSTEALGREEFRSLLAMVETQLKEMSQQILAGRTSVDPYRKGAATACDQCQYQAICRIDPWTHRFRALVGPEE